MKSFAFLTVLLLALVVGCSNSSDEEGGDEQVFSMDNAGADQDQFDLGSDTEQEGSLESSVIDDVEGKEQLDEEVASNWQNSGTGNEDLSIPAKITGNIAEYKVESGDTLMLIAFKLYGDYRKWHRLNKLNPGKANSLTAGTIIKYEEPETRFVWNPQGESHLILRGETLGTISTKYYNTSNKWKSLWENNRPMIQDPNLIFAGFTLYYIPGGSVALR